MTTSFILRAVVFIGLIGLLLTSGGCAAAVTPPPPITLDVTDIKPAADYSALDEVLSKCVKSEGLVDCEKLKGSSARLDDQLKVLAASGPTQSPRFFKTEKDQLAYWYNARIAWSLKLWLEAGCPPTIEHAVTFMDRLFPLDGRQMTLRQIDQTLARDGDWRTAVVAPSVTWQGAALPTKAFRPGDFPDVIAQRFNHYLDDNSRFIVDVKNQRVLVPPALWDIRDSIQRSYDESYQTTGATLQTALVPYLEGTARRRMRDAVGYPVMPMAAEPLRFTITKK